MVIAIGIIRKDQTVISRRPPIPFHSANEKIKILINQICIRFIHPTIEPVIGF